MILTIFMEANNRNPKRVINPELVDISSGKVDEEFVCKICNYIAVDPKMCRNCDLLYCQGCIDQP